MRLSEAIRLGAMMKPQVGGALFWAGGTCAIGAAMDALGHPVEKMELAEVIVTGHAHDDLRKRYPWLYQMLVVNPVTGRTRVVIDIVVDLNNYDRWTREQIADWVESIEREQECKPVETPQEQEAVLS